MPSVGLTGGYGTGKSTVARMFRACGARILDADKIAHEALSLKTSSGRRVVGLFGSQIVRGGRISHAAIARIVFRDAKKRRALEGIIHPVVRKKIRRSLKAARSRLVVIEVPLLIEAGMQRDMDYTVVVWTDRKTQAGRLRKRGVSPAEVRRRTRSQMPLARKKKYADFIIDNNGSLRKTQSEVKRIIKKLGG